MSIPTIKIFRGTKRMNTKPLLFMIIILISLFTNIKSSSYTQVQFGTSATDYVEIIKTDSSSNVILGGQTQGAFPTFSTQGKCFII